MLLFLIAGPAFAAEGFMLGGGAEGDSDGGVSAALVGSVGLGKDTWLSAGVAKSSVELESGRKLESLYADLELDHFFDPVGIRVGVAYWGDPDVLESNDWRASGYFRNAVVSISADYEYRDFDLTIPRTDFFPGRQITFDADGIGLTARFQTSENTNLRLRGIKYDYSVSFRPTDSLEAARLLSVTRLSLVNSLVDHRASISLSIDHGLNNWTLDASTWESIFTGSRTKSYTVRYLFPLSQRTDLELGAGYDDSELYGDVSFFSFYLFFYGD
ncbi:MAG: hypothetical protein GTO71_09280 [Woeseiaceae bacterium]|nr:hypothetical protein [Woeseiaceae bacterium]NIP21278.1 hypothetical protein [Woeseiaceae bacterium]NIS90250.1 hypothetical protein [Woeseiaceae bacterium]